MKAIAVEQLGGRLTEALEQQDAHEAIPLTKGGGTVAWVLRVPEALKDTVADLVTFTEGPGGQVVAVVQAKHASSDEAKRATHSPVFGAGRGTLTVVSEDDDHLKDFQEYMG
jgi:hypothetical protein